MSDAPRLQAGPDLRETAARAIASELGYDFDTLYETKQEWIDDRGARHDINVPRKPDFRDAADALLAPSGPLAPLLARIGELEAALEPFAKTAERYAAPHFNEKYRWMGDIAVGDLRRARSVLDQEQRHAG
jgi:hypothetical protein